MDDDIETEAEACARLHAGGASVEELFATGFSTTIIAGVGLRRVQQLVKPLRPQGLRSNVRTLTSTVRTLLGPTPALILLLAQCSNTCHRCCWHTVRTHVRLRAEASQENRAILSKFERFWTSSWQNVAPKTSSTCSNASWACC